MIQIDKMRAFKALHAAGQPLVLMNVWDAGTAKTVGETAATALATGSFSLAGALGFEDGEQCPRGLVLGALKLICGATDKPVSHDCERGYGDTPEAVGDYIAAVVEAGAVGVNIEDSLADGSLRDVDEQSARLAAAKAALGEGYLNARIDVFLQDDGVAMTAKVDEVITRAVAFKAAGADGLFVPGLSDLDAIKDVCAAVDMPVNVMRPLDGPPIADYAAAGVARISHGPHPWRKAMADLKADVEALP